MQVNVREKLSLQLNFNGPRARYAVHEIQSVKLGEYLCLELYCHPTTR